MTKHGRTHEQNSDSICISVYMRVSQYVLWSIFELFACQWLYVLLIADERLKQHEPHSSLHEYTMHSAHFIWPYEVLIVLRNIQTQQYIALFLNSLSDFKVSSFVFSTVPAENQRVHKCVLREQMPEQQPHKKEERQFLPMAFYNGLKALNAIQSKFCMI